MFRFAETEQLDRTALACAAGGALCAGVGAFVAPSPVWWLRLAAPAFLLVATARGGVRPRLQAVAFAVAAAIVQLAWGAWPVFADVVSGALVGTALALVVDRERRLASRESAPVALKAAAVALAAIAWPLALRAVGSVDASSLAAGEVPPVIIDGLAGAVAGLFMGLTQVPAFLVPAGDPVAHALQRARPTLDGELRDLVLRIVDARQRALKLLERSRADARARADSRRALDGVALAAIELTDRFGAVDRVLSRTPSTGVEQRADALRAQLLGATDAGVRRDLERAIAALDEQRAQIERLLQGRARLVARLESELASLERTEMSLALLASGDAAIAGVRLEGIGSELGRRAQELEAEGNALQEALTVGPAHALQRVVTAAADPAPRPAARETA